MVTILAVIMVTLMAACGNNSHSVSSSASCPAISDSSVGSSSNQYCGEYLFANGMNISKVGQKIYVSGTVTKVDISNGHVSASIKEIHSNKVWTVLLSTAYRDYTENMFDKLINQDVSAFGMYNGNNLSFPMITTEEIIVKDLQYSIRDFLEAVKNMQFASQPESSEQPESSSSEISPSELRKSAKSIPYKSVARYPDKYKGQYIKFSGKVVQSLEDDGMFTLRVAQNDDYSQMFLVTYIPENDTRILEDDEITVYGRYEGITTYTSTVGSDVTVPAVTSAAIDIKG